MTAPFPININGESIKPSNIRAMKRVKNLRDTLINIDNLKQELSNVPVQT